MKICNNCKKFYVESDEQCLNCGVTAPQIRSARQRRGTGKVAFVLFCLLLLPLCVTIPFTALVVLDERIYHDFGLKPLFLLIGQGCVTGFLVLLNRYLRLEMFTPNHELAEKPVVSDCSGESLMNWEQCLKDKLKEVSHSLAELKKHKNDIAPLVRYEEIESLALFVARWLNEVGHLFYLARTAANNDEIGALMTKTKVVGPKATGLVKQDLEPAVRENVEAAMKSLENLKTQQLRRKSLNFAQSVRADEVNVAGANETSEQIAGQAARLRLNEQLIEPITSDMFLKEKHRLEILELLR